MRIGGSLALITGASGGIGAATAKALAAAGAKVILLARTESKLEAVAEEIRTGGHEAHVYPCDLGNAGAVAETAERIKTEVGIPDIVINNAGAGRWLSVEETDCEEAVSMMGAPYFAAFFVTHHFASDMCRRGSGRIANINSPMAYLVIPGATGYAASRCALRGFNDALRAELHGTGVGVTHVVFGEVTSDYFINNPGSHERLPTISKMIPVMNPEQCARVVLHAIERDSNEVVRPWMMKLIVFFNRVAPRFTGWLMRKTGWKRPS